MEKLKVHIVTPERLFYDKEIDSITFFSTEGYMEVFYDHIPTTTAIKSGIAVFNDGGKKTEAVLHAGFAEVLETGVNIITDAAEWAEEIDLDRAKRAEKRVLKELEKIDKTSDEVHIKEAALERAMIRIELAEKSEN